MDRPQRTAEPAQAAFDALRGNPHRLNSLQRLLRELADLKRIRSAAFLGSFAEHRFAAVWQSLCRRDTDAEVRLACRSIAAEEAARAVAATRLSAISAGSLRKLGIGSRQIELTLRGALAEHADALGADQRRWLDQAAANLAAADTPEDHPPLPPCVERLACEPRAGATAPGRSRALVVPQESHADHCYVTAVTATLLAEPFAADPAECFLIAISHHLHNAYLPDGGFAGEMLLGECLQPVVEAARARALADLPPSLARVCGDAIPKMADCNTPAAAAVNAADSLDRLLQVEFHASQASFTAAKAIVELDIVHEGPLQQFQNDFARMLGIGQTI